MSAWRHEIWDAHKSKVALKDSTILKPQLKEDLLYSHEISKLEFFREDSPLKYVDFKFLERKIPQSSPRTEAANECFTDQKRLRHPPVGPASASISNSTKYVKDNFVLDYSDSEYDAICDSDIDFNFPHVTKDLDNNDNSDIVYSTPNDQVLDLRQKFDIDDIFINDTVDSSPLVQVHEVTPKEFFFWNYLLNVLPNKLYIFGISAKS